jgi:hypothetical protein
MCDGVQFDERSPVLYLVWDAISGEPLFGERKLYRGADDLVPLLERVRAMGVPVIGVVTDKEKGLVPAVERVFPEVPYQFCQTHFLRNCAKPLQADLTALQASVRRRADAVREVGKLVAVATPDGLVVEPAATARPSLDGPLVRERPGTPESIPSTPEPAARAQSVAPEPETEAAVGMSEHELVHEVCELVRVNSRISGKAPLDPPELKRHQRLEELRGLIDEAREKKPCAPTSPRPCRCWIGSLRRSRRPGTKRGRPGGPYATPRSFAASRTSCPTRPTARTDRRARPRRSGASTPTSRV